MKIELSSVAEKRRQFEKNKKRADTSWGLFISENLVEAVRWARDNGWKDKNVQVRVERTPQAIYYVEPYEEGCGCRGLLKYQDYFE